jgi:hypothetical protein
MTGTDRGDVRGNPSGPSGGGDGALGPQAATELGLVIRTLRLARKWSQDDLAYATRLHVRVIQRAEMGEATSREVRGALAEAFGLVDRDGFERPLMMPEQSKIAGAFSKMASERVSMPLHVVATGQELSKLFIEHPLDICLPAEPLPDPPFEILGEEPLAVGRRREEVLRLVRALKLHEV